jgi:excisionase family DNA binding protein
VEGENVESRLLYDRKEAARQLSISVRTLDRLIGAKEITARRIGRSVLIPHVELMKLSRRDVANV